MKGRLVCLFCYFVLPSVVQGVGFKNFADDVFIKKDLDEISNKSTIIAKLLRTVVPSPRAFQPSQEQIQQELTDLLEVIGRQRLALIETNDYLQSKVGYNKDVNDKIRYFDGLLNALSYDFTIPGFQRLKEKCQHVDERPYSLFNKSTFHGYRQCRGDLWYVMD
uniref:Secreted protein n=1 Tax=Bursaphelenchus xylophilus TaxID=6326 RepID=A0A1I7RUI6_BURXY